MTRALRERDERAISQCQEYAKSQARHPITVDFPFGVHVWSSSQTVV